uniref:CB1 cannabinoid receptor-interacting protein 1 n=1 Tax=Lynx canadensis TaxID=61383 RepID=A0A667GMY9_LYNCA
MGDLPGLVRLSIALRIQPNDGPVFFKVDGQRFGQNRTIKLLTGSSYKVEVKIKPTTLQVENISIGGVLVPLELKSKEPDGDRIVYTGTYDTEGVAPTKSGERQPIQITMPFSSLLPLDEPGSASPNSMMSGQQGANLRLYNSHQLLAGEMFSSPRSKFNATGHVFFLTDVVIPY